MFLDTLAENMNGPSWVIWIVVAIFVVCDILLLTGHGSMLIAGYNSKSDAEKAQYNARKLGFVVGGGMSVITVMMIIMAIFQNVLPNFVSYIFLAVTAVDIAAILILENTICKRK